MNCVKSFLCHNKGAIVISFCQTNHSLLLWAVHWSYLLNKFCFIWKHLNIKSFNPFNIPCKSEIHFVLFLQISSFKMLIDDLNPFSCQKIRLNFRNVLKPFFLYFNFINHWETNCNLFPVPNLKKKNQLFILILILVLHRCFSNLYVRNILLDG